MSAIRKALRDPMTILLFVLGTVTAFVWEPLRTQGWPWYVEMAVVVGGYVVVSLAVWAVARFFYLRKQRSAQR